MLRVLYFASMREAVGAGEEQVDLPLEIQTVDQLADWLARQGEGHASAFRDRSRIRIAVDQQFAAWNALIGGAREVAFFPPVTGG